MPVVIPPAGVSPAGFFVAQTFADPGLPPGILADAIDPATGEFMSIRMGMHPVDAQVLLAVTVKRKSGASVMDDGQDFDSIRKIDDQALSLIEAKTRLILKRLIDNRDIEIVSLTPVVDPTTASGYTSFQYRNLRQRRAPVRTLAILPLP
jgi:hypothetical protein